MLDDLLSICGFSQREQVVLGALLEHGPSGAGALAKRTALKRPTVYAVLEGLIAAGFVERTKRERRLRFSAIAPAMLPQVIESRARHRFEQVQEASKLMGERLQEMTRPAPHGLGGFEIATLESNEAVYIQLLDTLLGGDYSAIFNPQLTLAGEGTRHVADFLKRTAQTKPHIREIIVSGPRAEWYKKNIRNENHLVKEINRAQKIATDMIFISGHVVLSHYGAQKEMAIKISHAGYYQSMMAVFEMLWESLPS
jgi:sugar-specific transcriptional regulator TrmB